MLLHVSHISNSVKTIGIYTGDFKSVALIQVTFWLRFSFTALFGKNGQTSGEDPEECETELSSDCDSSWKNGPRMGKCWNSICQNKRIKLFVTTNHVIFDRRNYMYMYVPLLSQQKIELLKVEIFGGD